MKLPGLEKNRNIVSEFITLVTNESKDHKTSFLICLIFSFIIAIADVALSLQHKQSWEVLLISVSVIWNITFATIIYYNKKRSRFLPVLFSILLASILVLTYKYGFSTGSFFYFFPSALIYIINSNDIRDKFKFYSFFIIVALFTVSVFVIYLNVPAEKKLITVNSLFLFRLIASSILSALLIRHLLFTYTYQKGSTGRKNYFEALFQSDLDGYIVIEKETNEIKDFNRRAALLFELPYELSINGLYLSQFMMRYLEDNSVNLETLMNGLPDNWKGEGKFRTHNKQQFYAYLNVVSYFAGEKEFQILCIRDISPLKKNGQEAAIYKEKFENSAKVRTRFLSSMSHELRTPLNGIIGTSNLILEEPNLPENVKKHLNLQLYSSEHMLSIINDILDFSKIESGKMEIYKQPFNLYQALQNLVDSFKNQFKNNKIELIFDYDAALINTFVISDEVKLRQVLFNLMSNALKFTLDGEVKLSATIEEANDEKLTVTFKVKDTGIGIRKEKQGEIFEGFSQVHAEDLKRRFGGTGLGLTISQKLVNLFGGVIEVDSDIGKGACFYFSITFKKEKKYAEAIISPEAYIAPADIRGVRVLVVEDNEVNAAILMKFLQNWGIRIKEASNGIQALELMKYHSFDLVLMDLEMPEMNGYTAVKIIRETNSELPIIAFTATLLEDMDALITKEGFNDYILKPFRPAELKKKIECYVPHRKIEYA